MSLDFAKCLLKGKIASSWKLPFKKIQSRETCTHVSYRVLLETHFFKSFFYPNAAYFVCLCVCMHVCIHTNIHIHLFLLTCLQFGWDWADLGWARLGLMSHCIYGQVCFKFSFSLDQWLPESCSPWKGDVQKGKHNYASVFQTSALLCSQTYHRLKQDTWPSPETKGREIYHLEWWWRGMSICWMVIQMVIQIFPFSLTVLYLDRISRD